MPSAADLIFMALLGALVFTPLSVKLMGDAGIGWHIRTGQQILAAHAVPQLDSFSSTMAGKPWFAWEWLYDAAVGRLEAAWGLNGVVWFTALVIAAVFAGVFRILATRQTNLLLALLLTLLAMSASTIHFLARPHVVSWLFVLLWFWILDSTERRSCGRDGITSQWLWSLPVLMLLWVNVHGGFLLGFVLLGCFWAGSVWTWLTLRNSRIEESLQKIAAGKRALHLFWIGIFSAAASLINPYGWKLHSHIYSYLSDRFLMDHIEEFQSADFHALAPRCFLVLLIIALAIVIVRGRELRLSSGLLMLFAVYAGLYSSRNIPVSSILLVMIVAPLAPRIGVAESFFDRMGAVEARMRGHLWPILATLFTLAIAAHGGRIGSSQMMDAHFDPKRMPVGATTFLGTREGQRPILSPDYWGGYLIYRLYPDARVVVDDRHDLYGAEFLKAYLSMVHVGPGWDEFLKQHDSAYVVLPRHAALANVLAKTAGWRSIYADEVAIVFVRDSAKP
jgi:hypothetical protein